MTINHHLNHNTLMAHAAGSLSEGMRFVVETHLDLCDTCRNRLQNMESIGGSVIASAQPVAMRQGALDQMMSLLDSDEVTSSHAVLPASPVQRRLPTTLPRPFSLYMGNDLDDIAWRGLAPGVKFADIPGIDHPRGALRLLKIAPGATIPQHSHQGTELTMVLRGSYSDEIGRFKAGDIADLDDDVTHQPVADGSIDCICLIVTEGKLQFKTLVPKIVQYFTGM